MKLISQVKCILPMVLIGEWCPCLSLELFCLIFFSLLVEVAKETVAGWALGSQPRSNPPQFPTSFTNNLPGIPLAESMHYLP